jgi:hypothetical protein
MTLLEVHLAIGVLAVILMVLVSTTASTERLRRFTEEKETAREALQEQVAHFRSLGLSGVVAEFAEAEAGTTRTFAVPGLDRQGEPSGQVTIVTDETTTDAELGLEIGMPRDLDGDGLATNPDVSESATVLPVIVTVTWRGVAGRRTLQTIVLLHRPSEV